MRVTLRPSSWITNAIPPRLILGRSFCRGWVWVCPGHRRRTPTTTPQETHVLGVSRKTPTLACVGTLVTPSRYRGQQRGRASGLRGPSRPGWPDQGRLHPGLSGWHVSTCGNKCGTKPRTGPVSLDRTQKFVCCLMMRSAEVRSHPKGGQYTPLLSLGRQ